MRRVLLLLCLIILVAGCQRARPTAAPPADESNTTPEVAPPAPQPKPQDVPSTPKPAVPEPPREKPVAIAPPRVKEQPIVVLPPDRPSEKKPEEVKPPKVVDVVVKEKPPVVPPKAEVKPPKPVPGAEVAPKVAAKPAAVPAGLPKVVAQVVRKNDLRNIHIFIDAASLVSGKMPTVAQTTTVLRKEAPALFDLIKDEAIVLTGTTSREGVWAYSAKPQAGGEFLVVTAQGVENMTRETLEKRLDP